MILWRRFSSFILLEVVLIKLQDILTVVMEEEDMEEENRELQDALDCFKLMTLP